MPKSLLLYRSTLPAICLSLLSSSLYAQNLFPNETAAPDTSPYMPEFIDMGNDYAAQKKFYLYGGIEITNAYYTKGKLNEDKGGIFQPEFGIGYHLLQNTDKDTLLQNVDVYGQWWASFHTEETDATRSPETLYESDYTFGIKAKLNNGLTVNAEYWYDTAPNGAWDDVADILLKLTYDDAGIWDAAGISFPGFKGLQPYFKTVYRIQTPGDSHSYFWFGANPEFDILQSEALPITFSTPIEVGFGDGEWYGTNRSDFGYAKAGFVANMPLEFINKNFGKWSAYAGIHAMYIGDGARDSAPEDDRWVPLATFGLTFDY